MYVLTIARTESRDRAPQRFRAGFCDSSRKMPLFQRKCYQDIKLEPIEHAQHIQHPSYLENGK